MKTGTSAPEACRSRAGTRAEPADLADLADPTHPAYPADPTDAADPVEPADPADPADPINPLDSISISKVHNFKVTFLPQTPPQKKKNKEKKEKVRCTQMLFLFKWMEQPALLLNKASGRPPLHPKQKQVWSPEPRRCRCTTHRNK